jgi:hypothetical protein
MFSLVRIFRRQARGERDESSQRINARENQDRKCFPPFRALLCRLTLNSLTGKMGDAEAVRTGDAPPILRMYCPEIDQIVERWQWAGRANSSLLCILRGVRGSVMLGRQSSILVKIAKESELWEPNCPMFRELHILHPHRGSSRSYRIDSTRHIP